MSTHGFLAGFRYKKNVTQKAAVEHEPLGSIPVPGVVPGVLAGHERVTVTAKPSEDCVADLLDMAMVRRATAAQDIQTWDAIDQRTILRCQFVRIFGVNLIVNP